MPKIKNKVGMKFGKLTVLSLEGRKSGRTYWNCICDCGETTTARGDKMITGERVSCGCIEKQNKLTLYLKSSGGRRSGGSRCGNAKHNMTNTRFYRIWKGMKARCLNANNKDYPNYGGKGIKVYESWVTFEKFKNDMYDSYVEHVRLYGEKDTTLDRIDTLGNYEPDNCRWATQLEQQQNRTNNKLVYFKEKEYIASDLARKYNIKPVTFFNRLNRGWDLEKILYTPTQV